MSAFFMRAVISLLHNSHSRARTHAQTHTYSLLLMPCLPRFLILTLTLTSLKGLTIMFSLTEEMHSSVLPVQHFEGNTHRAAISVRLPKILGPRRAQRGPRSPTNCHNQRLHGGWTDVQKSIVCVLVIVYLKVAHCERRHAVTATAESPPTVFSLLPHNKIKMAEP